MAIAFCPDCEEPVHLGGRPKVGQRIVCLNCGADLEVVEVSPLELDWALDEPGEDWEGEDEEEEEEELDDDDLDDWDDDDDWDEDDWDDDDEDG
jgi:lysine biosynthesis protein LysW